MVNSALFSSNSDEWATPDFLFEDLNKEFSFNLDVCATANNHKCPRYFTKEDDGLAQTWGGARVFCNPPYSNISAWVKKAYYESFKPNTLIVMLIPARTDTKYFQEYILNRSEVRFIKGRLKFGTAKNSAPFPSMLVIFRAGGLQE
jgi:site-specific DNA-methyltransferase (adenine-specific)